MITITFGKWIHDYEIDEFYGLEGPIFSRWLPDGENDALKIEFPKLSAEVYLWFERHGFTDSSGFIRYEHKRFEIDPEILPRQTKIYAGALYGKVVLNKISNNQTAALKKSEFENLEYVKLGKLVIKKIVDPVLVRFTKLLKETYGQYWIDTHKPFDSRSIALFNHCNKLHMRWYLSDEEKGNFTPGKEETEVISVSVSKIEEENYITKESWFHLRELLIDEFDPSLSSAYASRANKLKEEGRFSHSLLEAVTSIELAIEEYIRRAISDAPQLEEHMRSFWKNPLPTRVSLVASLAGAETDDIGLSISGIKERNKFVHDGLDLGSSVQSYIDGLLRTISLLNGNQKLKYPSGGGANRLSAPEKT